MRRVVGSEWLKLRRRGMLGALLATVAVTALSAVLAVTTSGTRPAGGPGPGGGIARASLESVSGLSTALASASTLLGVIALGVFAASFAGEYSNGTLRNLLVCEPRRVRLLWGKFAGLASATVPAVGIAVVVSAGGAMVAAQAKGIDVGAWWTAAGVRHSAVTAAYLLLATLGWGLFGAVLALWFRSPVVAVSVGVAYALPLEAILGGVASGAARWLPGKLLAAIAAGGNDTVGFTAAVVTFAMYAAFAAAAATIVFVRRDVAT